SLARLAAQPALTAELSAIGIRSPAELASLLLMDRPAAVALAGDAVAHTDDNMIIEFAAPLNMYRQTRPENLELAMPSARLPGSGNDDGRGQDGLSPVDLIETRTGDRTMTKTGKRLLALAAALAVPSAWAQSATDWPEPNNYGGAKYSPLAQITPNNVSKLDV